MFQLLLAAFLAFACPKHNNNHDNNHCGSTTVTTNNDTGGEGGHIPPNPKG